METMEDDSEEFSFNDWVEEQQMKIREIHKSHTSVSASVNMLVPWSETPNIYFNKHTFL